jgi:hypothetical protein
VAKVLSRDGESPHLRVPVSGFTARNSYSYGEPQGSPVLDELVTSPE